MFRLSPEKLIAGALTLIAGNVTGAQIDEATRLCTGGLEGAEDPSGSWDARFIQHCGRSSHYDFRKRDTAWPIPPSVHTTPQLAEWGAQQGVLFDAPMDGDIYLQYGQQRKAFIHCGIIVSVLQRWVTKDGVPVSYEAYNLEGDTDQVGRLEHGRAMRIRRRLRPHLGDKFLRWTMVECPGLRAMIDFAQLTDEAEVAGA
ncbi:MAG: hypothetical protein ABJE47_21105 [bacterium]